MQCIYSYVFETPLPQELVTIVSSGNVTSNAPHPFIIEPPEEEQQYYGPDDLLNFHVILIGKAIEYFPYFLFTFDELGRIGLGKGKGRYQLESAYSIGARAEVLVYTGSERRFVGVGVPIAFEEVSRDVEEAVDRVEIEFLTPTRLKYGHKLTSHLEFHVLFRALLLRLSLLALCHGEGGVLPLPTGGTIEARAVAQYFYRDKQIEETRRQMIHEAIESAKRIAIDRGDLHWRDWERYSARQDARMKLGGLVGRIRYSGPLNGFLPYLLLGEYVHVGKNTSFGLGKMKLYLSKQGKSGEHC